MLLLMRQHWRASINRFAEAMTLFAVAIAGLFPIMHLGRPLYFYWLAPYPEHDDALAAVAQRADLGFLGDPQLSPVLDHLLVCRACSPTSPRCAIARDSAWARRFYGAFALGWRGSARHWQHLSRLSHDHGGARRAAGRARCTASSGFDFAASLMPGWQETIFPPYFVVGAMYSGFAMVVLLAALVRWGFGLQALITVEHFDVMAKVMLASSIIMGLSYATEWFTAWYGGARADRDLVAYMFTGSYAPLYWRSAVCNVLAPQAFWFTPMRRNICGRLRHCRPDQHRHVARAHPDHLEHAVARLFAEHAAPLHADDLGLADASRLARLVRDHVSDLRSRVPTVSMHESRKICWRGGASMSRVLIAEFAEADAYSPPRASSADTAGDHRCFTPVPVDRHGRVAGRHLDSPSPRHGHRRDRGSGAALCDRMVHRSHRLSGQQRRAAAQFVDPIHAAAVCHRHFCCCSRGAHRAVRDDGIAAASSAVCTRRVRARHPESLRVAVVTPGRADARGDARPPRQTGGVASGRSADEALARILALLLLASCDYSMTQQHKYDTYAPGQRSLG